MKISTVGNRVGVGVVLTLSIVVLLMLVTTMATPAIAQATGSVRVSNLDQPSSARYTVISPNHHYAQSFCTGSVATTLDKVRLYTISQVNRSERDVLPRRSGARRDHTLH